MRGGLGPGRHPGSLSGPLCSLAAPSLELCGFIYRLLLNTQLEWGHREARLTPSEPVAGWGGMQGGWNPFPGRQAGEGSGPRLLLWTVSSRGRKVIDSGPRGGSLSRLRCSNRHLRPRGRRRRHSPGLWQGSKEHPRHQPSCWPPPSASRQPQRGEEQPSHGGDVALFLAALAHHQLLPLGLRQPCCTPGAGLGGERGVSTLHRWCPERQRCRMEQPREHRPKMQPWPGGRGSEHGRAQPSPAGRAPSAPRQKSRALTASARCPAINPSHEHPQWHPRIHPTPGMSRNEYKLRLPSPECRSRKFSWVTVSKEPIWQQQRCWGSAGGTDSYFQLSPKSSMWL